MAARFYPRNMLAAIMLYFGAGITLTALLYSGQLRSLPANSRVIAGIFSYTPLDIFLRKMLDFNIMHEAYIISGITALCLFGWLLGLLYRYHNPDPQRPRIET
jgi:hypothetical protein